MFEKKILAIIPARSGSKSVPHKNIKSINGKPLMAHSIKHALDSKNINRVIVSTDSEYYAEIAKSYGAEVPFLRPKDISDDLSNDIDFFKHALENLKTNENYEPDILVQLRPTHPIRNVAEIDEMIEMLSSDIETDSVRSVQKNESHTPYKMWKISSENRLIPIIEDKVIKEAYNEPRQNLPVIYFQNGSVDVIRTKTITEKNSLSGDKILGYIMDHEFDIDTMEDFDRVKNYMETQLVTLPKGKTFVIDVDGVIAQLSPNNDYTKSEPIEENIEKINQLFDAGNEIIMFTARGYKTGIDWTEVTKKQFKKWGLKYHELKFGKPAADYYIDDKLININNL